MNTAKLTTTSKHSLVSTRNNIDADKKIVSIQLLNRSVSTLIDIALITKQAHWNLKGPDFIAAHEMLDGFYTTILGHVDTCAERAVQLGGMVLGTVQTVHKGTPLDAYPTHIYKINDHLTALADRYGQAANLTRSAIDEAGQDADTVDIFTAASRDLDKFLWFLESHLID